MALDTGIAPHVLVGESGEWLEDLLGLAYERAEAAREAAERRGRRRG